MARTPNPIGSADRYFSPTLLRRWALEEIGEDFTIAELARRLTWSETATRHVLRGDGQPFLESYLRALAATRAPLGSWLDLRDR